MPEPAKKSQPRKTAAKKATATTAHMQPEPVVMTAAEDEVVAAEEDDEAPSVEAAATDLAFNWLFTRAFPHGQWAHAQTVIEDSTLPDEVKSKLLEAYGRASA
jgi:hypothetical protein